MISLLITAFLQLSSVIETKSQEVYLVDQPILIEYTYTNNSSDTVGCTLIASIKLLISDTIVYYRENYWDMRSPTTIAPNGKSSRIFNMKPIVNKKIGRKEKTVVDTRWKNFRAFPIGKYRFIIETAIHKYNSVNYSEKQDPIILREEIRFEVVANEEKNTQESLNLYNKIKEINETEIPLGSAPDQFVINTGKEIYRLILSFCEKYPESNASRNLLTEILSTGIDIYDSSLDDQLSSYIRASKLYSDPIIKEYLRQEFSMRAPKYRNKNFVKELEALKD